MKIDRALLFLVIICSFSTGLANVPLDYLVEEVHTASAAQRVAVLERAVDSDTLWPRGVWGDTMWALSLLYLNERVEEANARIRMHAQSDKPFAYFGMVDYVRILWMFNERSSHYPGRLEPEAEAAMKAVVWKWAKDFEEYWEPSRIEATELEDSVWSVYASENHDLIRKGNNYLIFSLLTEDPEYKHRICANGRTVEEYHRLYTAYFKTWLKQRAASGIWMEIGAEYAKYSYSVLFNFYDLSPDPDIRRLSKMLLDVAFIEEAQISFEDGFRGGGKSRIPRDNPELIPGMGSHKKLLYGEGGSSSHSRVFETSQYKVPDIAIFLRKLGDSEPSFLIRNRVLGESVKPAKTFSKGHGGTFYIAHDSALVNYTFKTPAYMMGSTLQLLDDKDDGYGDDSGITRQDRWGGVLFNDGARSKVMPWAERTPGSSKRVHNAYWQVQDKNLMIAQKTYRSKYVERMMVYLSPTLDLKEIDGWLFGSTVEAWVAVTAVGGFSQDVAAHGNWPGTSFLIPTNEYAPIVFFAGSEHDGFGSFEEFRHYVLKDIVLEENRDALVVKRRGEPELKFFTDFRPPGFDDFDSKNPYNAGSPLRTTYTYDSPYLRTGANRYLVWARWGGYRKLYDFEAMEIKEISTGSADMRNDQHSNSEMASNNEVAFEAELTSEWKEVFRDDGKGNWGDQWFLDGEYATISNIDQGMEFTAGPTHLNNAHHAVLWTKRSFKGDIKVEYEYTKLDDTVWCVNILYLQATGEGQNPYVEDISQWNDLRAEPRMPLYFEHMNLYHISYSAWDGFNEDPNDPGYIRARRYTSGPIEGTELYPDEYTAAGFFQTGVPHKITAIKSGNDLYFNVENLATGMSMLAYWENTEFPPILKGRIGLRHMFTRSARYGDFKVFERD